MIRTDIILDGSLVQNIMRTLDRATQRLADSEGREDRLRKELDRSRLLTEQQAQDYLQRDANTVRFAISWDGKGRALGTIYVERFWRTLKYELGRRADVYLRNYHTGRELRAGLIKYFRYYNHQRPHPSLGYRTPATVLMEGKEK